MPYRKSREKGSGFEVKKKNPIQLGNDSNLDKDFKPIKIGGESTILNLSESTLDINGSLKVNGDAVQTGTDAGATELNELSAVSYSGGDLLITSLDKIVVSNLAFEKSGDPAPFFRIVGGAGDERTQLTLYEAGGASENDYMNFDIRAAGNSVISTNDAAGTGAHLELAIDGNIVLNPAGECFIDPSSGGIKIKESADAIADTAAYGQLWVHDDTPNTLWFTNDAGNDIQITDGANLAGGGGGTQYWHQMLGGYKTNNNSSGTYYTYYRLWYENWSNGDSSPTNISYTDSYAGVFTAPRAGRITNIKIQGTAGDTGFDDPFKFYFYKSALSSDASSMTLTAMFNTSSITPPTQNRTWSHTEDFSSSNTFAEDDVLYIFLKKDSTSANQDLYFNININGEYS